MTKGEYNMLTDIKIISVRDDSILFMNLKDHRYYEYKDDKFYLMKYPLCEEAL